MSLAASPTMSAAEWQARCELAALYRVSEHLGWTDLVNTHISARIPDEPDTFLINHYGELFEEITPASLVKMDMRGNVIGDSRRFNKAGFAIHSGVLLARPDANFVLHTHTRAGMAASLLPNGLRPISQDVLHVYDDLAYHAYGMPSTQEECDALGETCRLGSCVVLHNHGLLTFGRNVHGTMLRMYKLDRACDVEVLSRSLGVAPVEVDAALVPQIGAKMRRWRDGDEYGRAEWQALLRKIGWRPDT
ncbi:hypothetical protein GXW78_14285 [Roseomonas terrae]|uniref:Class II aldolase/adducin N-terminal domain-containing protein n=1 Tax=Neoroseomonas terrae TaxID=424799 RepID=A0ABS5EIJ0_9PROT|nr:class II aldolase/adducin family protein [Neoroseomonas terrae]MBR0650837.1 hypothetical protein [Neoroseomonas terrae]